MPEVRQGFNQAHAIHKIKISVIVPMFNEEDNAGQTILRIYETLQDLNYTFEIIPVNEA